MSIAIVAEGVGTWTLSNGVLNENLSRMTASSAKIGGEDIPLDAVQGMLDSEMVNQPLSSNVTITATTMHLVDAENVVTDCTR
jgi:hypothetical protein